MANVSADPENDLSDSEKSFEVIVTGVLITIIATFGIIGNILTLLVLSRRQMRSSINCYLIGMASFDMIILINALLLFSFPVISRNCESVSFFRQHVFPNITPFFYPIALMAQTGTVWSTVTVTVERYIAVCHPLRARSLCTVNRAKIVNVFVAVFAVIYNIPRFFEAKLIETVDSKTNKTYLTIAPSQFRENPTYQEVYHVWMYLTVMYFIPFITLSVLNAIIWRTVRLARQERERISRKQDREVRLAIMLFVVVLVFFACNLVAMIVNFMELTNHRIHNALQVGNLLVVLNSSVNVIIYSVFGQKFRKVLSQFIGCKKKHYFTETKDTENTTSAVNIIDYKLKATKSNSVSKRETQFL